MRRTPLRQPRVLDVDFDATSDLHDAVADAEAGELSLEEVIDRLRDAVGLLERREMEILSVAANGKDLIAAWERVEDTGEARSRQQRQGHAEASPQKSAQKTIADRLEAEHLRKQAESARGEAAQARAALEALRLETETARVESDLLRQHICVLEASLTSPAGSDGSAGTQPAHRTPQRQVTSVAHLPGGGSGGGYLVEEWCVVGASADGPPPAARAACGSCARLRRDLEKLWDDCAAKEAAHRKTIDAYEAALLCATDHPLLACPTRGGGGGGREARNPPAAGGKAAKTWVMLHALRNKHSETVRALRTAEARGMQDHWKLRELTDAVSYLRPKADKTERLSIELAEATAKLAHAAGLLNTRADASARAQAVEREVSDLRKTVALQADEFALEQQAWRQRETILLAAKTRPLVETLQYQEMSDEVVALRKRAHVADASHEELASLRAKVAALQNTVSLQKNLIAGLEAEKRSLAVRSTAWEKTSESLKKETAFLSSGAEARLASAERDFKLESRQLEAEVAALQESLQLAEEASAAQLDEMTAELVAKGDALVTLAAALHELGHSAIVDSVEEKMMVHPGITFNPPGTAATRRDPTDFESAVAFLEELERQVSRCAVKPKAFLLSSKIAEMADCLAGATEVLPRVVAFLQYLKHSAAAADADLPSLGMGPAGGKAKGPTDSDRAASDAPSASPAGPRVQNAGDPANQKLGAAEERKKAEGTADSDRASDPYAQLAGDHTDEKPGATEESKPNADPRVPHEGDHATGPPDATISAKEAEEWKAKALRLEARLQATEQAPPGPAADADEGWRAKALELEARLRAKEAAELESASPPGPSGAAAAQAAQLEAATRKAAELQERLDTFLAGESVAHPSPPGPAGVIPAAPAAQLEAATRKAAELQTQLDGFLAGESVTHPEERARWSHEASELHGRVAMLQAALDAHARQQPPAAADSAEAERLRKELAHKTGLIDLAAKVNTTKRQALAAERDGWRDKAHVFEQQLLAPPAGDACRACFVHETRVSEVTRLNDELESAAEELREKVDRLERAAAAAAPGSDAPARRVEDLEQEVSRLTRVNSELRAEAGTSRETPAETHDEGMGRSSSAVYASMQREKLELEQKVGDLTRENNELRASVGRPEEADKQHGEGTDRSSSAGYASLQHEKLELEQKVRDLTRENSELRASAGAVRERSEKDHPPSSAGYASLQHEKLELEQKVRDLTRENSELRASAVAPPQDRPEEANATASEGPTPSLEALRERIEQAVAEKAANTQNNERGASAEGSGEQRQPASEPVGDRARENSAPKASSDGAQSAADWSATLSDLTAANEELRAKVQEFEASGENSALRRQIEDLTAANAELRKSVDQPDAGTSGEKSVLERKVEDLTAANDELWAKVQELEASSETTALRRQVEDLATANAELRKNVDQPDAENSGETSALERQIEDLTAANDELRAKVQEFEAGGEHSALRSQVEDLAAANAELRKRVDQPDDDTAGEKLALERKVEDLTAANDALRAKAAQLETSNDRSILERTVNSLTQEKYALAASAGTLRERIGQLEESEEHIMREKRGAEQTVQDLTRSIGQLRGRNRVLEENLTADVDRLFGRDDETGFKQRIGDLLRVHRELEDSLEDLRGIAKQSAGPAEELAPDQPELQEQASSVLTQVQAIAHSMPKATSADPAADDQGQALRTLEATAAALFMSLKAGGGSWARDQDSAVRAVRAEKDALEKELAEYRHKTRLLEAVAAAADGPSAAKGGAQARDTVDNLMLLVREKTESLEETSGCLCRAKAEVVDLKTAVAVAREERESLEHKLADAERREGAAQRQSAELAAAAAEQAAADAEHQLRSELVAVRREKNELAAELERLQGVVATLSVRDAAPAADLADKLREAEEELGLLRAKAACIPALETETAAKTAEVLRLRSAQWSGEGDEGDLAARIEKLESANALVAAKLSDAEGRLQEQRAEKADIAVDRQRLERELEEQQREKAKVIDDKQRLERELEEQQREKATVIGDKQRLSRELSEAVRKLGAAAFSNDSFEFSQSESEEVS
ncbi:hypothetical protein DIPPA_04862 [Diplonema papillatum]|nr:hypothetical protein DIPPA_04862 [Diplonema papillatum]